MTLRILVRTALLAAAAAACSVGSPPQPTQADAKDHDEHATPAGLHLSLDDGARWPMDEHTRAVMGETRTTLAEARVETVADAHALGGTLKSQLDRLIGGCTMTGAAHDTLHGFLAAYMPAVDALNKVDDPKAAQAQVAALQAMVVEYDRVFE